MGGGGSKLEKQLGQFFPDDERYFGLENFTNTCYASASLQALYFCSPFRQKVLEYAKQRSLSSPSSSPSSSAAPSGSLIGSIVSSGANMLIGSNDFSQFNHHNNHNSSSSSSSAPDNGENMLTCLAELFLEISTQKKKTGAIAPRKFISRLRKENELFSGFMHQDAHEFFNYLINEVAEITQREQKNAKQQPRVAAASSSSKTWVHDLFEGILTNETRCLSCETRTSREEAFLDLSVDVEQHKSLSQCLRNFSSIETLSKEDKFFCDRCCSLQEAQKRMRIKRLPKILSLHLKRFKYIEELQRHKKLAYCVEFPFEMRFGELMEDAEDSDKNFELFAVIIHVGSGPNHGHYVSMVKSKGHWLLFDDEIVELIDEKTVRSTFGCPGDVAGTTETGYILLYRREDCV